MRDTRGRCIVSGVKPRRGKILVLSLRFRRLMVKNKVIHCQSSKSGDLMTSIPYQRQFIPPQFYRVTLLL